MRSIRTLLTLASAVVAGCSSSGVNASPTIADDFGTLNGAKVELLAQGGIAALSIHHVVTHDDRTFLYTMGHLCSAACPAALDSASGTLPPSATDSLFNIVVEQLRNPLRDDYGTTPNSADMMSYTLRVTTTNGVKVIRADDGTMPDPMRKIVQAVTGVVSANKHR